MTTNGKSGARDKIHISKNNVSHPIQTLDSIKSKKSSQQKKIIYKKSFIAIEITNSSERKHEAHD